MLHMGHDNHHMVLLPEAICHPHHILSASVNKKSHSLISLHVIMSVLAGHLRKSNILYLNAHLYILMTAFRAAHLAKPAICFAV